MDKRALLTIAVCGALFFAWLFLINPLFDKPAQPEPQAQPQPTEPDKDGAKITPSGDRPDLRKTYPAREETVEIGQFRILFTSRGGGIKDLHTRTPDKKDALLLSEILPNESHFTLDIPEASGVDLRHEHWGMQVKEDKSVRFEYQFEDKWKITKDFVVDPKNYTLKLFLQFESINKESHPLNPMLYPFQGITHDSTYRAEDYVQAFAAVRKGDGWSLETFKATGVNWAPNDPAVFEDKKKDWLGLKNRYFAAVLLPDSQAELDYLKSFRFHCLPWDVYAGSQNLVRNITTSVPFSTIFAKEQPVLMKFTVYLGPIRDDELKQVPRGLDELYDPSGFDFVAAFILWILTLGFSLFGNHGVAILFTTLVIRLLIFPLSKKSQTSMHKISQLGPKLAVLRDRYKDDRERFGQEQMKLFRENKINPMSGCLPMLLQLPIFIGMYGVLDSAIDLRQSPFMLWIHDLSQPDYLVGPFATFELLFFSVNALNLLPIVMLITWFLQAYFAPRSTDPQMAAQQKMMMIMPIVFGIMCYNLASGLSFYFFVNSLFSMAESKLIKKFFLPKEPAPVK